MRRASLLAATVTWLTMMGGLGTPPAAHAAQTASEIMVAIEPVALDITLGDRSDIAVTVSNHGSTPTSNLVVHIDIVDPARGGSVDPEDWTATLTRSVGVVDPGATASTNWTIQPIAQGDYRLFAVAISSDESAVAASDLLRVRVDGRRTINPQGILPVAIAAPSLVGLLLAWQLLRGRRRRP